MNTNETICRIFPASRDLLQLQAVADKHGVALIIGGEPLQVKTLEGFGRERHPADWVVAYVSGNLSNLIGMRANWQEWLLETADQYDQMLHEEIEAKADEIHDRIMQKNKKDAITVDGSSRPSREAAEVAIREWLDLNAPGYPTFEMCEDGDEDSGLKCGWAFSICPHDRTSYLHADMTIEWYGTMWPDDYSYNSDTGDWVEQNAAPENTNQEPIKRFKPR